MSSTIVQTSHKWLVKNSNLLFSGDEHSLFGYIRPYTAELLVKEYEIYKSIYCSFCKNMGKSLGLFSRLFLNYDCTFLILLSFGIKKDCSLTWSKSRCKLNPTKKRAFCTSSGAEFEFAGSVCVILTHYKLLDNIKDTKKTYFWGILKKIIYYILLCIIRPAFKKATKAYPFVFKTIEKHIKEQETVEKSQNPGIDQSCQPSSKMLGNIFSLLSNDKTQARILYQLGYFTAKWVYLIDAVDDIKKDEESGAFNPFILGFQNKISPKHQKKMLNQTLAQIILACNLLDIYNFEGILSNIINLGLQQMQQKILGDDLN